MLGYPVQWHEYEMPHSLCPEELDHIGAFLRKCWSEACAFRAFRAEPQRRRGAEDAQRKDKRQTSVQSLHAPRCPQQPGVR